MRLLKSAIIGAALSTLAISGATTAFAAVVVQNGGFESNPSSIGQVNTTNLPDWSATAAVTGSTTYGWIFQYATGSNGTFGLYNSTTTPGSTGPIAAPPGGGGTYFYGADATFNPTKLSQSLTGLKVGQEYAVTFDWAAAQQITFSGETEQYWAVSLGGQTKDTTPITIQSQLFSGWEVTTLDFVATSSTETLSFVADAVCPPTLDCGNIGQSGGPPFTLLDNVSIASVPEPSTWALMIFGFASLAFAGYRNRRKAVGNA